MTKTGLPKQSQKPSLSGAERQRRYRLKKGGMVSIDLEPAAAEALRQLRKLVGGTTSKVLAEALTLLAKQVAREAGRDQHRAKQPHRLGPMRAAEELNAEDQTRKDASPGDGHGGAEAAPNAKPKRRVARKVRPKKEPPTSVDARAKSQKSFDF